jgi:two-component system sensor histidine kinase TtrS
MEVGVQFNKRVVFLLVISSTVIGLLVIVAILSNSKSDQIKQTQKLLVHEATAHYEMIKELQLWHNKSGGIFKANSSKDDYHFNIYSLNPKNRENRAKGFAKEGLEYFEKNSAQQTFANFYNDNQNFQFIGVLRTKERCTVCHTDFKVGEVRGGIEIELPLDKYRESIESIHKEFNLFSLLIYAFFTLVLVGGLLVMRKMFSDREKIEELNSNLENRVAERTHQVQKLYNKEHYLKKLLETISELNETLINSYSLGTIIESSLETLKHHPNYKLTFFAHFNGQSLHIRYKSGDLYNLIDQEEYYLAQIQENPFFASTFKAIKNRHWSIETIDAPIESAWPRVRQEDYDINASISFTLIEHEGDESFDVLSILTNREKFDQEEISILDTVSKDITMSLSAFKQRKLTEHLQEEQITNYEETILAFVDMIEQRDAYTAGHTLRVAQYSRVLAEALALDNELIRKLEKSAILHDIGKIATPDTILLKPARLTPLEYELIKNHVTAGYNMLSKVKMYSELAEIMKYHHEHYDGTGYPYGYKEDEIPIESHILIVADAFDAMTTNRIYKGRLTVEQAVEELNRNSGTQFHPRVVDAANKALATISISQTTQLPQSELEQQRFSYFFNDSLTGVYNDSYLQLTLNQLESITYVNILKIRNFSEFNRVYGWSKGNELLVLVANLLKEQFPQSQIFRYEGDDFLVLSQDNRAFDSNSINLNSIDEKGVIRFENHFEKVESNDEIKTLLLY